MKKDIKIDNKAIGQRIRDERENLGLSREEFAEMVGLSDYYIGQLERGERQMSLPVLVRVSNCLHISLDYLVFGITSYTAKSAVNEPHNKGAYNTVTDGEISSLLNKCSAKELELFKKLIKTILPYL